MTVQDPTYIANQIDPAPELTTKKQRGTGRLSTFSAARLLCSKP